ncbi:MAG: peptide ABC transporter substrate-binding protein [Lactobacillaceae bacterium]|jgi:oligopeptide transport system substrate-binding protein|nr:peptide ABC transporter substrate-binding protein [Lactobacillaceae bacterium]
MNKWIKSAAVLSSALILGSAAAPAINVSAAKYKTINWTEVSDLTTMDSSKATDSVTFDSLLATNEMLYRNDKNGKPTLAAAKSVKKSADGLTYTFTLRKNLKWSNGEALTAKDFVYGWQRTNDPKTASEYAYLYEGIKNADKIQAGEITDLNELGIKATDDYTLVVTLDQPVPQLVSELTMATFAPQNKKFVEAAGSKYGTAAKYVLSSGPYVLKGWTGSNSKYTLQKNTKYWDKKSVKTNKVSIQTVKDQNTGYNLFKSGDVDFTTLSPAQVKASKNSKDYYTVKQAWTKYLEVNQEQALFKNLKVRQAISYAINRKQLANNILTGAATPASTLTPKGLVKDPNTGKDFATEADTGLIKYNAKKAKKLWAEAKKELGKTSFKTEILTDDADDTKRTAQFIQSQLEKNLKGLEVTIKAVPKKQRLALGTEHKFDIICSGWGGDFQDPITFLDLFTTGKSFNRGQWSSAAYDKAIEASKTTDANNPKKRYDDFLTAEKVLAKDMGIIPTTYASTASLFRSKIKGMVFNMTGAQYDWKTAYKK